MSDSFSIDVREVKKLADGLETPQVKRIVGSELITAGQRSGRIARDRGNQRIGNKSGNSTGRLAKSAVVGDTVGAGFTFTTDVTWNARSDKGFPYARVHHDGRGPVAVVNAKALRFVIGGQVIFAKSVGPAAGSKYAERGLRDAGPQITAEHNRAAERIARKVEAL